MVRIEAALPGEFLGRLPGGGVHPGTILVRNEDKFDERETQRPVPIREAALKRTGLRSQKSKVMGQRPLYSWSKGTILRALVFQEDETAPHPHRPLSQVGGRVGREKGAAGFCPRTLSIMPGPMGVCPPSFGWGLGPEWEARVRAKENLVGS